MIRIGRLVLVLVGILTLGGAGACALASCRSGYEAPCTIGPPRVVLEGTAGTSTTLDDAPEPNAIVVTIVHPQIVDPDAGVARVPGMPASVDVVVFHGDGTVARRDSFATPDALLSRHGSTATIDATYNGSGVVFSWVETETSTAPDGIVTSSSSFHAVLVGSDKTQSSVLAPRSGACTACRLAVSTASAGGITAVILTVLPDGTVADAIAPPPILLRLASDGTIASETTPAFFGGSRSLTTSPGVASENGLFFFFESGRTTITDPALAIMVGPVAIPNGGASAVDWDPQSRELEVGWASNGGPDGGAVGVGSDILLQRLASDGSGRTRPERITTGGGVVEMRRRDGRVGTIVVYEGRDYFVLADDDGTKIGGDVEIGQHGASIAGPLSAVGGTNALHRLFALGGGHYVDWTVSPAATTTREITCAR